MIFHFTLHTDSFTLTSIECYMMRNMVETMTSAMCISTQGCNCEYHWIWVGFPGVPFWYGCAAWRAQTRGLKEQTVTKPEILMNLFFWVFLTYFGLFKLKFDHTLGLGTEFVPNFGALKCICSRKLWFQANVRSLQTEILWIGVLRNSQDMKRGLKGSRYPYPFFKWDPFQTSLLLALWGKLGAIFQVDQQVQGGDSQMI